MNKTAPATLICQICKKTKSPHEGTIAELIRPSLVEFIKKSVPEWDDKGFVCLDDLGKFRKDYVKEVLQDEIGELSALDNEVIESLQEHEILSSDISKQFETKLTFGERLSDRIASFGGSWRFIILFGTVLFGWIILNAIFLLDRGFDPYPFILLNLILSCLAAIQAPIIMMSQNRSESRDRLRAELLLGEFIAPVAEAAFGKFLNIPLVNEGYALAFVGKRVLDSAPDQALGSSRRNRLDANSGVPADLLLAAFQHVVVQKFEQLFCFGRARLPLDADVHVFGIFTEDEDVQFFGMLNRGGNSFEVAHRTLTGIEIENLAQRDVERTDTAANGGGERSLDGHPKIADSVDRIIGQPLFESIEGFFAGEHFVPGDSAFTVISMVDCGVKNAARRSPDVPAGAVAFDERNDRIVRNLQFAAGIIDGRSF